MGSLLGGNRRLALRAYDIDLDRDRALVEAWQAGDASAFDDLYRLYFDRLRARVRQAGERGIYVSVMLFQGWSSAKPWLAGTPWLGHPYHPDNNLQGFHGNTPGASGPDLGDPRVRERRGQERHENPPDGSTGDRRTRGTPSR